jgi:hypothetical protein
MGCYKSHTETEKFNVKVYFKDGIKTFTTNSRPLIVNNNEAIVIRSDNGNEYYYKLSMIDGYEIERYSIPQPF